MTRRRTPPERPTAAVPGDTPVTVAVRVKPGAGRTRVGGCHEGPHGPALVVAVCAPAVDGKATEAVRRALADALGMRPAVVSLRLGATSRDKLFTVQAPADVVDRRVRELRDDVDHR
jgi:uncharacterized protein YggU (UPF0235/DUF167 family)